MAEQGLDEIVQITVEDFHQNDRTGKSPMKQYEILLYYTYSYICILIRLLTFFSFWMDS